MIKIIKGTYGLYKNGFVKPITAESDPISIDPRREEELIEAGIAERVVEETRVGQMQDETEEFEVSEKYLKKLGMEELKEFASQFEITYKPGTRKSNFIQLIIDKIESNVEDGELIEEVEEDGETPTLDAEEAVQ